MPSVGALLAAGLALLVAACGGSPTGGIMAPPPNVTLLDVQAQVFSPHCALSGCHVEPFPAMGMDLSAGQAAANIIGVTSVEAPGLLRVEPFDAANSYLYMKLIGDPGIGGDPMPLDNWPLSAGDLDLIETWIDQGAM